MVVKKRTSKTRNGVLPRLTSCAKDIAGQLSRLPEIDAVFLWKDDAQVVHVFSVVREFVSRIYERLLKKERAVQERFPSITFDFHVRAHQGRKPAEAVPFDAELVYER